MNKLKGFLKSKWVYRLTDNQLLLMMWGVMLAGLGSLLLIFGLMDRYMDTLVSLSDNPGLWTSGIITIIGFIILSILSFSTYKNREEIK